MNSNLGSRAEENLHRGRRLRYSHPRGTQGSYCSQLGASKKGFIARARVSKGSSYWTESPLGPRQLCSPLGIWLLMTKSTDLEIQQRAEHWETASSSTNYLYCLLAAALPFSSPPCCCSAGKRHLHQSHPQPAHSFQHQLCVFAPLLWLSSEISKHHRCL